MKKTRAELQKAVIEAAREVLRRYPLRHSEHRNLRDALSALDQAASGPECAQKGHAYATNKGECCIYCFRPKAECLHMGEPASEAEVTERAIAVGDRVIVRGGNAVAGYKGHVIAVDVEPIRVRLAGLNTERHFAAGQLELVNPEATESATKEAK